MVKELAANLALIDRLLERYGPEATEARARVWGLAETVLDQFWPRHGSPVDFRGGPTRGAGEGAFEAIAPLEPRTDVQRLTKARAQEILVGLGQARRRLAVTSERSIPPVLIVLPAFRQAMPFAGFGLLAPRNATTVTILITCMLSVSGALFLVMEFDRPFEGMVRVSDAPLRSLIGRLGE